MTETPGINRMAGTPDVTYPRMHISTVIERSYMRLLDAVFARRPQPQPCAAALDNCRLIAHRGEYDNRTILENTLAAFDRAAAAGVWGIELDVRWTRDLAPVVIHDPDMRRLFGSPAAVERLNQQELRRHFPGVPFLAEVVERFGRRLHLMIEIKAHTWPDAPRQNRILKETLDGLSAVDHYHFMALKPQTLSPIAGFPSDARLAIAYHWPDRYSRWVVQQRWGGLCAHYSMMRRSLIERHQARGQKVGTAYPNSRNSLYRELNRGVDWIFTNDAGKLQSMVNRLRKESVK